MRISAKADYAVRALVQIALGADAEPVTAERVAADQGIPRGFLLTILADLRRAGLVVSQRGQAGGWRLGRDPEDISIADVIRAVDGPLATVHGIRPEAAAYSGTAATLQQVWIAVRSSLREVLESVSLADLVSGELPPAVMARTRSEDAWRAR